MKLPIALMVLSLAPLQADAAATCEARSGRQAGVLLELASQRDAAVIALSDHGFGPCRALVNVNGLLQRAGLQRKLTSGTRFRYRINRLSDRLRGWKARRAGDGGRRQPRSIDGEVGCDWRRTTAFARTHRGSSSTRR